MHKELYHYGILGMKWGVRRYQNADGTLTAAGQKRYGEEDTQIDRKSSVAKKVAVGAAVAAGVAVTAYLVKKYGSSSTSDVTEKVTAGKEAAEKLMETVSTTAASGGQTATKTTSAATSSAQDTVERIIKAAASLPVQPTKVTTIPASDYETLMKQNSELLEKMYADLI